MSTPVALLTGRASDTAGAAMPDTAGAAMPDTVEAAMPDIDAHLDVTASGKPVADVASTRVDVPSPDRFEAPDASGGATTSVAEVVAEVTPNLKREEIVPRAAAARIRWGDDVPLVLPMRDPHAPKPGRTRDARVAWPTVKRDSQGTAALTEPRRGVNAQTSVRTHLAASARDAIERDLCRDLTRERGGVLVGTVERLGDGRLVVDVRAAIPAEGAEGGASWLQMTPESWEYASRILETRHPGLMIVGWYHSHPGIGCFFSGTDRETQRHIFPNPWNLGAVGDPVAPRSWRGVFGLREAVPPRAMPFRWYLGPDSIPIEAPMEYDDAPVVPRMIVRRAVTRSTPGWRRPRQPSHRRRH